MPRKHDKTHIAHRRGEALSVGLCGRVVPTDRIVDLSDNTQDTERLCGICLELVKRFYPEVLESEGM